MQHSPYTGIDKSQWLNVTEQLIQKHPLSEDDVVNLVLSAWENIFETSIGKLGLKIGHEICPKPQVIGALLHELIPAELAARNPCIWRPEQDSGDKDLVYIPDDSYSIELKTSSNPKHIFGNRSYAQKPTQGKKSKDGYYIAVNFEKFSKSNNKPSILAVRFGWIDHTDWIGQAANTGQQCRLPAEVYELKLKTLYTKV